MEWIEERIIGDKLLQAVLTAVQDGISFLSKDLDIIYSNRAMDFWYTHHQALAGMKCYQAFHDRDIPCDNCPVLRAFQSMKTESEDRFYEKKSKKEGWQRIFCVPVTDENGDIQLVVEYVRDMTNEKKSEFSLELARKQMETYKEMVADREKLDREKQDRMISNLKKSFGGVLSYLEKVLDGGAYEIVKKQMDSAFEGLEPHDEVLSRLSEKEIMVARYIADGYMSKEIADELMISKKTVDYHRTNIRRRLGLSDSESLSAYLKTYLN